MTVQIDLTEGLAHLTLDDGKANAFNATMMGSFKEALDKAEEANAALLLSGRAGFFSGGLDLKTLPTLGREDLVATLSEFCHLMLRIFEWPRPVVAACTGHAIAGGSVLLLTCDERYATEGKFKIGLNETQIGLSLPRFVVEMARCQLAAPNLRPVVLQGQLFSPDAAVEHGIIDKVLAADEVLAHAKARASQLAELPRSAYADTKHALRSPFAEIGRDAAKAEIEAYGAFFENAQM